METKLRFDPAWAGLLVVVGYPAVRISGQGLGDVDRGRRDAPLTRQREITNLEI